MGSCCPTPSSCCANFIKEARTFHTGHISLCVSGFCGVPWNMLPGEGKTTCLRRLSHLQIVAVRHAEGHPEDGRQSFNDWRTVLSANSGIWIKGPTKERHSLKGVRAGRYEGAVIDAPWIVHLPKLIVW